MLANKNKQEGLVLVQTENEVSSSTLIKSMLATVLFWSQIIKLLQQKMGTLKIMKETQEKAVWLLAKAKKSPLPAAVK